MVAHVLGVAASLLLPSFSALASVAALRFFPAAMVVRDEMLVEYPLADLDPVDFQRVVDSMSGILFSPEQ